MDDQKNIERRELEWASPEAGHSDKHRPAEPHRATRLERLEAEQHMSKGSAHWTQAVHKTDPSAYQEPVWGLASEAV